MLRKLDYRVILSCRSQICSQISHTSNTFVDFRSHLRHAQPILSTNCSTSNSIVLLLVMRRIGSLVVYQSSCTVVTIPQPRQYYLHSLPHRTRPASQNAWLHCSSHFQPFPFCRTPYKDSTIFDKSFILHR